MFSVLTLFSVFILVIRVLPLHFVMLGLAFLVLFLPLLNVLLVGAGFNHGCFRRGCG